MFEHFPLHAANIENLSSCWETESLHAENYSQRVFRGEGRQTAAKTKIFRMSQWFRLCFVGSHTVMFYPRPFTIVCIRNYYEMQGPASTTHC